MQATKWGIIFIIIILAVGAISRRANNDDAPATEEPIKIGAVLSLSGPAVQDGESIQRGLEMAKTDLANTGVNVELIYQDDHTDSKDTVSAINAVAAQGVKAIIGPTWSYLADAGVPVLDRLKMVAVMPANTSEYVEGDSPYVFFTATRVDQLIPELTSWLEQQEVMSIAVIRNQGAWYETVGNAVAESLNAVGGEVTLLEEIPFDADAALVSTTITKLMQADVDLVFLELDDEGQIVTALNRLQEQGFTGDVMSVTTAVGRVVSGGNVSIGEDVNLYVLAPETSEPFEQKYAEAHGVVATAYADTAYDSLMLLVEAIQSTDGSSDAIAEYLKTQTNYQGFAKTYSFNEDGDVEGGEWTVVGIE